MRIQCDMGGVNYFALVACVLNCLPILQGNKGGVSIRFDVGGVNLIIVNCHLAAHLEQMAERIEVGMVEIFLI